VKELSFTDSRVESLKEQAAASDGGDGGGGGGEAASVLLTLDEEMVRYEALRDAACEVMRAVTTEGVHHLVNELGPQIESDAGAESRRWACWLAEQFFAGSEAVFTEYLPVMLKLFLSRVAETEKTLLQAVINALQALSTAVPHAEFMNHVDFMRSCISSTASAARHRTGAAQYFQHPTTGEFQLPIFRIPKSLDALFVVLLYALMNGSVPARETAAEALGELAQMADAAVLKPLLIKTTGPLIRVIGDRFPSTVKAAILQTLCTLLNKGGIALKAFAPQLQTTFVKSLNDPARDVRGRAVTALGKLMPLSARVDPLLMELSSNLSDSSKVESNVIKVSMLDAMAIVLLYGGNKVTPAALETARVALRRVLAEEDDDAVRARAARALSRLSWFLPASELPDFVYDLLDGKKGHGVSGEPAAALSGRLLGLGAVLQSAGTQLVALDAREEAYTALMAGCKDEKSPGVCAAAVSALATMLSLPSSRCNLALSREQQQGSTTTATTSNTTTTATTTTAITPIIEERRADLKAAAQVVVHNFAQIIGHLIISGASSDIRTKAMIAAKHAAKFYFGAASQHYNEFLPPLVDSLTGIDLRVKYSAERALKHLCEGLTTSEMNAGARAGEGAAVQQFISASTDRSVTNTIRDYSRRVLASLPIDSEDEGYD